MSHWILLIIVLNVCRISANKYCSLESNGEPKYFICARNEYCCHFGCCVHLAFQFYQLWYYWLLLIFMFMLCSGGSWWYKFCRHSETTSSYPSLPPTFENRQNRQHVVETTRRNRSIDRNTADNSFYFQRIWKANGMGPPPNYYTASVVRYHSASELETRRQQQECPYYQLYGPPPSYESVVRIPENGCGQPSCTLVPATVAASTAAAVASSSSSSSSSTQQGNILTQPPPSYISENLPLINSYNGDNALVAGGQHQQQQQQIPMPSTSIQVDFVGVPVHQQHHHHHQQHLPSTSTPEATCRATSPLQFRSTGCRLDFGPTVVVTPSASTSTKTTGTATSPVLEIKEEEEREEEEHEGRLPRSPEDQV